MGWKTILAVLAGMALATAARAEPAAPRGSPPPTASAPRLESPLRLESSVRLVRHGVRPPTKDPAMPAGVAAATWPAWDTPPGWLTTHGTAALAALGRYDRIAYSAVGLLPGDACPAPGAVDIWADVDERTVKSAEAWAAGFAPGCDLAVGRAAGDVDPLFSPIDAGAVPFDPDVAVKAIAARLPPGGLAAVAAAHKGEIDALNRILGCCSVAICDKFKVPAPCGLGDLPSALAPSKSARPKLSGPLDYGSTAAEILLLEYTEGKPMTDVGWGRASRADIQRVLALHPLEFDLLVRAPYVARANAGPLAARMLAALEAPADVRPRVTILLGHDTNIASLGGLLDLHWTVDGFPADDPPPGGSLGFERLRDGAGQIWIRAVYEAQTMDQMRDAVALTPARPPFSQTLVIPGCSTPAQAACPLDRLAALVRAKLAAPGR